jgi:hypothetical protein
MDGSKLATAPGMQSRSASCMARRSIGMLIFAAGTAVGIPRAAEQAGVLIDAIRASGSAPTSVELSLATALTSIGNSR